MTFCCCSAATAVVSNKYKRIEKNFKEKIEKKVFTMWFILKKQKYSLLLLVSVLPTYKMSNAFWPHQIEVRNALFQSHSHFFLAKNGLCEPVIVGNTG